MALVPHDRYVYSKCPQHTASTQLLTLSDVLRDSCLAQRCEHFSLLMNHYIAFHRSVIIHSHTLAVDLTLTA